jgi:uncharacterized protein (DUF488 family)
MAQRVLSIGHGGRELEVLIGLVAGAGGTTIVDVRSQPYSRYQPEFSQSPLRAAIRRCGLTYVFLGHELGGRPEDRDLYDDGRVNYERFRQHPLFLEGLARLTEGLDRGFVPVLLCSESRPENCHRSKAIGAALDALGVQVDHIDADGQLVSQQAVIDRLHGGQLTLTEPGYRSRGKYLAGEND